MITRPNGKHEKEEEIVAFKKEYKDQGCQANLIVS